MSLRPISMCSYCTLDSAGMHAPGCPASTNHWYPSHTINTGNKQYICPDLLRLSDIGEADGWRGRVVRGFFWALKKVTGV